ncbi:A/G-specific adenine glycosylase [Thermomicrobium sp. 4228-Ro]|uniref:A/G-specific adenine glycosylase n=1 Tax=Thermomicrobium sp. 4228-Ro TaxID=2993937 RepID=UPI0022490873|nr:A/G-specific adenine glycosylase [Thermomicrobium sp. 4228-Ro]MCX2727883.1 A/G-specific adenine glycosylase [Thermomicrobium sp. 4228-Ro]
MTQETYGERDFARTDDLRVVHERLLSWYAANARDLPWRRTRDPYRILVSEVMLQQTQVERVIPAYEAFLSRFPTIEHLAAAPLAEVIAAWGGLGYNRRAVYLWRAARQIVEQHGGEFPRDRRQLEELPGVGRYTAGAVLCFAFGQPVAFWDTNIARVLTRIFLGPDHSPRRRDLDALAERVLPLDRAYEWNQALMELGARVCTSRSPRCEQCPVRAVCRSVGTVGMVRRRSERFAGSRRYYRGRIVAALRRLPAGVSLHALRELVGDPDSAGGELALEELVEGLARDGLVEVREEGGEYFVRLPGKPAD